MASDSCQKGRGDTGLLSKLHQSPTNPGAESAPPNVNTGAFIATTFPALRALVKTASSASRDNAKAKPTGAKSTSGLHLAKFTGPSGGTPATGMRSLEGPSWNSRNRVTRPRVDEQELVAGSMKLHLPWKHRIRYGARVCIPYLGPRGFMKACYQVEQLPTFTSWEDTNYIPRTTVVTRYSIMITLSRDQNADVMSYEIKPLFRSPKAKLTQSYDYYTTPVSYWWTALQWSAVAFRS
ncbi:hypothetical protein C8Q80DRAFT_1122565 [Daedaleopsis nitida]|nr:hypothetical protein C8Q80DRAFT_1122565 [Daedaleopsis nitida]